MYDIIESMTLAVELMREYLNWFTYQLSGTMAFALLIFLVLLMGGVPVPFGWERGKVRWLQWCHTGQHPHYVYLDREYGFSTLHPDDREER